MLNNLNLLAIAIKLKESIWSDLKVLTKLDNIMYQH